MFGFLTVWVVKFSDSKSYDLVAGDTAQCIARGLGFRFTDVRTLFYHDNARREAAGLQPVELPSIDTLEINYRTHAGVLDAASVCIDALIRRFPNAIDRLPRERAHFRGSPPMLLKELNTTDLALLMSGTSKADSQVEFGAHQAVLVRDLHALAQLPPEMRRGAITMTVPQAKGLDFDDVFSASSSPHQQCVRHTPISPSPIPTPVINFFSASPCSAATWRMLLDDDAGSDNGGGGAAGDAPSAPPAAEADDAGIALDREAEKAGFLRPETFDPAAHVQARQHWGVQIV